MGDPRRESIHQAGGGIDQIKLFQIKVYFSGGAVATYALFQMDGSLRCSGNVYDYDGYIREGETNRAFRPPDIVPTNR